MTLAELGSEQLDAAVALAILLAAGVGLLVAIIVCGRTPRSHRRRG